MVDAFKKDFNSFTEATKKTFLEKPELVDAWKVLDDAGLSLALRRDQIWLNKVSEWTREGLNVVSEGRILNEGREVGRIVNHRLHVKYGGYGEDIICNPTKTTTAIGKYNPPEGAGTKQLIDSKLSKSGENPGGLNVLNDTRNTQGWSDQKIWDEINEPWLREAVNRGDVIRVVSDPTLPSNIYKPDGTLSFFGREHELLTKPVSQGGLGYVYDSSTFSYVR